MWSVQASFLVLVSVWCLATIDSSAAVSLSKRSVESKRLLPDQLYAAAAKRAITTKTKRSKWAAGPPPPPPPPPASQQDWLMQPEEPSYDSGKDEEESMFAAMTTEELMRMLELLDMLETRQPIKASDHELATLQYLLKNYQN